MGHDQSKANGAVSYADLRRRHEQVPDAECLGARMREANTGVAITGGISSCYGGATRNEPDICPINDFPKSTPGDDAVLSERGNSKGALDAHDIMKDSGFQEPTKLTNGHESRNCASTSSESGPANESAGYVTPNDQSTILEQGEDAVGPLAALNIDSSLFTTTIKRSLTLPVSTAADTPELKKLGDYSSIDTTPGYSHRPLWTPDGLSLDIVADGEEMVPTGDEVFNNDPPAVLSYAALRRKNFREAKYGGSLPARPAQVKEISRSASTISDSSFDVDCGVEIPASTSFTAIEQELQEVLQTLLTDLTTVSRLTKADTGEYFSSPLTTRKLSNMVSEGTPQLELSRAQINKGFSILRKHSSLSWESPRMSSLPPTPEFKKCPEYQVEAVLAESKSFHDIPRYVVHEDIECHTEIVSDDTSLDSLSTVETGLSSGRCDSIPSMNSMISEDEPSQRDSRSGDELVVDIAGYVSREWKGDTRKADLIRKGYHCVINEHKCRSLVRIRGDNYCALRASYCSMLLNGVETDLRLDNVMQRLEKMHNANPTLLNKWVFPQVISDIFPDKFSQLADCLLFYLTKTQSICRLPSREERIRNLFPLLNTGASDELFILEAMKLLMLLSAYELHRAYVSEQEVPVFVWLLFARDTSETVASFLSNHINRMGQDAGLEQIEMCLLGHALGVTLQTFRLYQYGEMDFIARYPEDGPSDRLVPLVAEDDRHYNTPLLTTAE